MAKRVSAMEVRKRFGEIMNEVSLRDDEYIIERDGKPMAAVIPIWKLEQLEKMKKEFCKKIEEFREIGSKTKREELESVINDAWKATKSEQ